jgi:hypothetical protein
MSIFFIGGEHAPPVLKGRFVFRRFRDFGEIQQYLTMHPA